MWAELGRVDEDRDHGPVAAGQGLAHQRQMAVVQGAHGRHEADREPGGAPGADLRPQLGHAAGDGGLAHSGSLAPGAGPPP